MPRSPKVQKGGIVARDGGKVTISGNTVTGWGHNAYIAQNGVQVSYGTTATVKGNTISGHDYTPTDWTATGLLIYQAGGRRRMTGPALGPSGYRD